MLEPGRERVGRRPSKFYRDTLVQRRIPDRSIVGLSFEDPALSLDNP